MTLDAVHIDRFLAALPASLREEAQGSQSLAATLKQMWQAARTRWPELKAEPDAFLGVLATKLAEGGGDLAALGTLPSEELYLAVVCARGDDAAIRAFEARHFTAVRPALRRMQLPDSTVDEVMQLLRQKLFVADEQGQPPLLGFVGKGNLSSFVRVVATRIALNQLRSERPHVPAPEAVLAELASPEDTPQIRYLKARHHQEFKEAFEEAVRMLTSRERNLLRLHFVDHLSIDELGHLYHVHRATAARHLARARERLAELTRAVLRERLVLSSGEFESVVRLVQSQLDMSITRVLGDSLSG